MRRGVENPVLEGDFVTMEGERGPVMPQRIIIPSSRIDRAYIAGIIDGEGCITRWHGTNGWGVQVGMTNEPVITWLAEMGGTVIVRAAGERRKEQYIWRVLSQNDIIPFLRSVLPYLRVKHERAQECLADLEMRRRKKP